MHRPLFVGEGALRDMPKNWLGWGLGTTPGSANVVLVVNNKCSQFVQEHVVENVHKQDARKGNPI